MKKKKKEETFSSASELFSVDPVAFDEFKLAISTSDMELRPVEELEKSVKQAELDAIEPDVDFMDALKDL